MLHGGLNFIEDSAHKKEFSLLYCGALCWMSSYQNGGHCCIVIVMSVKFGGTEGMVQVALSFIENPAHKKQLSLLYCDGLWWMGYYSD